MVPQLAVHSTDGNPAAVTPPALRHDPRAAAQTLRHHCIVLHLRPPQRPHGAGPPHRLHVLGIAAVPAGGVKAQVLAELVRHGQGRVLSELGEQCPRAEDLSLFDEESGLHIPFTLNRTFSAFSSRSLNEKAIESAEEYETVFLTPDSNS